MFPVFYIHSIYCSVIYFMSGTNCLTNNKCCTDAFASKNIDSFICLKGSYSFFLILPFNLGCWPLWRTLRDWIREQAHTVQATREILLIKIRGLELVELYGPSAMSHTVKKEMQWAHSKLSSLILNPTHLAISVLLHWCYKNQPLTWKMFTKSKYALYCGMCSMGIVWDVFAFHIQVVH